MTIPDTPLTVAVTGPTGTFGSGLLPLLQDDDRIGRVVGLSRGAFDPAARGWTKVEHRRGDVRDAAAVADAVRDADVVVHLAFLVTGSAGRAETRAVNVEGTRAVWRAAAAAGVHRFVYASSVAAYGFHADNPAGMTEDWPVRPAGRLFYAQEKAEVERLLAAEAASHPGPAQWLLRPPLVVGPNAVGGKDLLPGWLAPLGRRLAELALRGTGRLPFPLPVAVPALPLQLVHEDDVGAALLQCVLGAGPPGPYNIAADDVLTLVDVVREFGAVPVPLPAGLLTTTARALAALPLPAMAEWVEAAAHPTLVDSTRAREDLGWRPHWSALGALRDTLRH